MCCCRAHPLADEQQQQQQQGQVTAVDGQSVCVVAELHTLADEQQQQQQEQVVAVDCQLGCAVAELLSLADEQQQQQKQDKATAVNGESACAVTELHRADTLGPHL